LRLVVYEDERLLNLSKQEHGRHATRGSFKPTVCKLYMVTSQKGGFLRDARHAGYRTVKAAKTSLRTHS
jgi:hypothetical protein